MRNINITAITNDKRDQSQSLLNDVTIYHKRMHHGVMDRDDTKNMILSLRCHINKLEEFLDDEQ